MTYSHQRPPVTGWQRQFVLFADRVILWLSTRWLAIANAGLALYVLLPVLAPVLMANDAPQFGRAIYTLYAPACHQLPERSFFMFGPQTIYSLDELWALGEIVDTDLISLKRFLGSTQVGFKMALCERDIGLYGGMVLGGLIFALFRRWIRPLPLWGYGLSLLPMIIDGGTQLIGLRESNWILRLTTGLLVGLGTVWVIYPHIQAAFFHIQHQAQEQLAKARHAQKSPDEGTSPL